MEIKKDITINQNITEINEFIKNGYTIKKEDGRVFAIKEKTLKSMGLIITEEMTPGRVGEILKEKTHRCLANMKEHKLSECPSLKKFKEIEEYT